MAEVIFYLLDEEQNDAQPAPLALACRLAAQAYRSKQACLVLCEDKQQAEAVDELLWQLPVDAFVPHNLTGEGPPKGTPVEIAWQGSSRSNKPVLINLASQLPEGHQRFKRIFDFVPADDQQKQQARERYKQYRGAGHQLDTRPANSIEEN
ncbi:DNA polymerase III subunit chi [Aliiglaciecola sp. CAU 1673]|uniref:DNA polymerase III subunit chi n=1 Tax=Aliiglaciecola sp. CAU 1673 TaxID=3032595 RepID=UPI0023DA7FEA|nr:DNA polymerase III subunit chi [Aliiglaciecola sp. CAU 1673]MDF2178622.1 DNA polymerase III subunit chi [Aliiglaciecola sp. CAU 1673]